MSGKGREGFGKDFGVFGKEEKSNGKAKILFHSHMFFGCSSI